MWSCWRCRRCAVRWNSGSTRKKYNDLVEQYAAEYDLDPLLVYSFIRTESGFDPGATSSVDARGLMQMTEETFLWLRSKLGLGEEVSFGDLYDPDVSIRFGCYYLHLCLVRYNGDISTAAAAYHSGWGTVDALLPEGGTFRGRVDPVGFPPITRCTTMWKRSPPAMPSIPSCTEPEQAANLLEPACAGLKYLGIPKEKGRRNSMAEKTPNQQLAEKLLYKPAYVADKDADVKQKAHDFAEGYKKFLDAGKTEREVAAESEQMLKDAGYQQFDPKKNYKPGDKIYFVQCNKAVVASTIGTKSFEDGFHLVIAHTDSPRLDLRPTPLYESDHLSYFKTHYYGGIRKYQWGTIPLSIHGVFTREDGSTVTVRVGEDENDPVFCITDLLPHLGAEQNARPLKDGIKAEELNILIGSDAVDDENVKEAVKLNTMILLNEKYGITEKEFMRAEIEITPAYKSRDVGFDRSMVGGYGHDDRVDAYPALMAEIETKNPAYTTVCVLTDKEEIGSDGVTGMQSMYAFHFMQELCRTAGQDDILAFRHSVCLSADVTAAYDPTWASAFEPMNGTYAGRGVAIFKYTGGGSKGSASDACAELVSDITRMLDNGNVAWQIGELGRLDLGGGGTIAKYVANRGIPVLDIGVPVLSMHAPFEVIHKNDLYMAYRAFSLFNNAQ